MTEPLSRLPTLSRRTLLAGAAAAGLTAGMPPVRAAGLRWDGEAEIVIVGSGGAGVSAALAARERTKGRIVILEKLGVTGGSTRFSCGYFNAVDPERQRAQGIEDSLERHIADTNASGRGRGDPELVRILCSEALDALHWVSSTSPSARRSTAASFREATCRSSPTRRRATSTCCSTPAEAAASRS